MQQVRFNTQKALADGFTPEQINQYIAGRQKQGISLLTDQPEQSTQQPQQKQGNGLLDLLPLIGSVAGSFTPLGPIVGGGIGGAAGQGAKELFGGGGDITDVAKEGLLGGAGGVLGKGLGFLGGKAADVLGNTLIKKGEEFGVKGLRLNPSQITKFNTRHGEDVGRFLASEGALGKDSAKILEEHIQPLQKNFNQIAKKSGLKVNPDTFIKNIDEQAQQLIDAGGSENRDLAEQIRREGLLIWQNDLTPANFDISKVDKLRSTFAKKVNWNNPQKATMDHAIADALRKTAIDTADEAGAKLGDMSLRDIGIKLSKYRDLEKAAVAQEALGRGKMPMGITNWLSLGAGLSDGGVTGGLTGLAANAVVNSPKFSQFAAKASLKAGDALKKSSGLGGTVAGRTAVQSGVRAPFANGEDQTMQDSFPTPSSVLGTSTQTQNPQEAQQENLRKTLGMLMLTNAKTGSDAAAAFNFLFPADKQKQKTETQVAREDISNIAGSVLNDLATKNIKIGPLGIGSRIEDIKGNFDIADPNTLSFNQKISALKAAIAKARAGTSFTPNEERLLNRYTPNVGDSKQQIETKIQNLVGFFQNVQDQGGTSSSTPDLLTAFNQQ